MKKQLVYFVVAILAIALVVVVNTIQKESDFSIAGGPRVKSLKELNDTTKTSVIAFAQGNITTEESLYQVMTIGNWERDYRSGLYVGADLVGTVSSQFGIMCPTYDVRAGWNFNTFRLEAKVGNFTRNGVTTAGFDPQFGNFCVLAGEAAPVSNAVQLAFISNKTKLYAGHQAGSSFYAFDGNYYAGVEQKISNVTVSGGMDFAENTTGYAAVKWSAKNNTVTVTGNKLGAEAQNFVLSYVRSNIPVFKGIKMNVGSAFWTQPEKKGLQLVTAFNMGRITLFAQAGGYRQSQKTTPVGGLGINYNM